MSGVIHYNMFTDIFGAATEPKNGDVMKLTEYGSDRLNYPKRGPTAYQLTEVIDEFQGNPLGGHYVWFFKAKRYDYSHESAGTENDPNAGTGNIPLDDNDAANQASLNDFDYVNDNSCDNTSVYGNY